MIAWLKHNFGLVAALAALLIMLLVRWEYFLTACPRNGDYALLAIQVELAKEYRLLVGPYSRFGFNHPLPTYSYYYALFAGLFKSGFTWMGKLQFAVFLLNAFLLLWTSYLIQCFSKSTAKSLLFFACSFYLIQSAHPGMLINIWGPATLLCPLLLFLVSLAAYSSQQIKYTLLVTKLTVYSICISAVLLSSNHLTGFVLAMAGLLFFTAHLFINRSNKLTSITYINVFILFIIAFSPILIDVALNFEQSNLFKFITIQSMSRANIGLILAAWQWLQNLSSSILLSGYLPSLLLWMALIIQIKYFDRFHKQLFYYLLLLNVVSIYVISKYDDPNLVYLYWFLDALVAVHLYLVLQKLVDFFANKDKLKNYLQIITFALIVTMLSNIYLYYRRSKQVSCDNTVAQFIETKLDPEQQYIVKIIGPKFPTSVTLLVYYLYQQNYNVCVTGFFKQVFGKELVCTSQQIHAAGKLLTVRKIKEATDYNSHDSLIIDKELIRLH